MRKLLSISFILSFALLFWSCAGGGGSESSADASATIGVTDTEITIGSFGPLTGPAALWGNIMKGMDAHFQMINDEGGINGRKINFIMKDDAYDPSRTVPAVRELVQRNEVFAFVGGIGTAPCMSVMDYIVEENIPWFAPTSGATNWSIPTKPNIFAVLPYYIDEGYIQAKYAVEDLNATKVGIIYQNDDVGKSALVGAKDYFKKNNMDFVSEVPVEVTDTDLSSHIARLQDSGAEVVLLWTLPRQGVITVTSANRVGFEPQFIASFILSDMGLMHGLTKGAWEGVIYGSFGESPYSKTNEIVQKYKAATAKYYPDVTWGVFPYSGFAYVKPFADALRSLGDNVTREGIIDALNKMNSFDLIGVTAGYSKDNHQAIRSMQLLKCVGAEEYEELSELITSDSDIHALIEELEAL
ncbi:MAG: ABC transporter substrate-binding protein [Bacteroidia bacterium]|nr:ABC transporter substrate-binding protein [Bacteroidia bacterium]